MSVTQSRLLYISIVVLCSALANGSQKIVGIDATGDIIYRYRKWLYFFAFIVPWFFIAFTNVGSDYNSYYYIIGRVSWSNFASYYSEEPLMNLVFLGLKIISHGNIDISIFILKTLTIGLVFLAVWICRNELCIGTSILAYTAMFYLPSFYLLSICFASSFVLVAVAIYLFYGKWKTGIAIIVFAGLLHNAAFLFLPVYLACGIVNKNGLPQLKKIVLVIGYFFAIALAGQLYYFAQKNISGFHYNQYSPMGFSGSGLMIVIKYLPLFYLVYRFGKMHIEKRISNCFFVFVLTSFLFNVLSYSFPVIERMEIYLDGIYILCFPFILANTRVLYPTPTRKTVTTPLGALCIAYILFRGVLVLIERTSVSSGIGNYIFFNPFR